MLEIALRHELLYHKVQSREEFLEPSRGSLVFLEHKLAIYSKKKKKKTKISTLRITERNADLLCY